MSSHRYRKSNHLNGQLDSENALKKHNRPYILLKGDRETRLKKATDAINKIISDKENLHSFSDSLQDIDMHFMHQNNDFGNSYDY